MSKPAVALGNFPRLDHPATRAEIGRALNMGHDWIRHKELHRHVHHEHHVQHPAQYVQRLPCTNSLHPSIFNHF
eukprot:1649997-Amphidinium_carterae.1